MQQQHPCASSPRLLRHRQYNQTGGRYRSQDRTTAPISKDMRKSINLVLCANHGGTCALHKDASLAFAKKGVTPRCPATGPDRITTYWTETRPALHSGYPPMTRCSKPREARTRGPWGSKGRSVRIRALCPGRAGVTRRPALHAPGRERSRLRRLPNGPERHHQMLK